MSKLKWNSLLMAFFLITTITFIPMYLLYADGKIAPSAENLFDDSESFTPLDSLPVVDTDIKDDYVKKDTEGETIIDEKKIAEDLETISISRDGQIDTVPANDYEVEALQAELLKVIDAAERDTADNENNMSEPDEGDYEMKSDWQLDSVIGDDSRVRVEDTTVLPYRAVGRIDNGCTGTLIGPRHVLTAGHCVYNIEKDQFYKHLDFSPGQNGESRPYGKIGWGHVLVRAGWRWCHLSKFNYAVIILKEDIGNTIGWMWPTTQMPNQDFEINGYSAYKKPKDSMWRSMGKGFKNVTSDRLYYDCDTDDDSGSGGAIIGHCQLFSKEPVKMICGIHTNGVDSTGHNSGIRINQSVFNCLNSWIADY